MSFVQIFVLVYDDGVHFKKCIVSCVDSLIIVLYLEVAYRCPLSSEAAASLIASPRPDSSCRQKRKFALTTNYEKLFLHILLGVQYCTYK